MQRHTGGVWVPADAAYGCLDGVRDGGGGGGDDEDDDADDDADADDMLIVCEWCAPHACCRAFIHSINCPNRYYAD